MHSKVDFKKSRALERRRRRGGAAAERGGGSEGGEKFRRGGQICKALELRGRASHLIRRRFYSPRRPNPDKLSAIREPPPPSLFSPPASPSPPHSVCRSGVRGAHPGATDEENVSD